MTEAARTAAKENASGREETDRPLHIPSIYFPASVGFLISLFKKLLLWKKKS